MVNFPAGYVKGVYFYFPQKKALHPNLRPTCHPTGSPQGIQTKAPRIPSNSHINCPVQSLDLVEASESWGFCGGELLPQVV